LPLCPKRKKLKFGPINCSAQWKLRVASGYPYKRIGEPDDIAQAAVWLVASDAADYVTGAILFVDGGMTLCPGFATGG
jgi:NAD(P)-dependent dehydrogenase (short-subunit alcohol dehydrogenase family)